MGEPSEDALVVEGSGGVIWDLLEVPKEESLLHAELTALFGGSAEVTEAETVAFLAALRDAGMVEAR